MWPVSTSPLRCPARLRKNVDYDQPVRGKSADSAEPATALLSARAVSPEWRAARTVPPKWRAARSVRRRPARTIRPAVSYAIRTAALHHAARAGASAGHHDLDLRDPRHLHHHLRAHRLVPGK